MSLSLVCILALSACCAAASELGALRPDILQAECRDIGCKVLRAAGNLRRWLEGEPAEPAPRTAATSKEEAQRAAADAIMDSINKANARNIRDQCGESNDAAALRAVQMNIGAAARACSGEARARGECGED